MIHEELREQIRDIVIDNSRKPVLETVDSVLSQIAQAVKEIENPYYSPDYYDDMGEIFGRAIQAVLALLGKEVKE